MFAYAKMPKLNDDDDELLLAIGRHIAEARNARNITAKDLAVKIGMDNQNLSKVENGKQGTSAVKIAAISQELSVSCDWLLLGIGEGPYDGPERPNDTRFPWLAVFLSSPTAQDGPRWKRDRLRDQALATGDAPESMWADRYRKLERGPRPVQDEEAPDEKWRQSVKRVLTMPRFRSLDPKLVEQVMEARHSAAELRKLKERQVDDQVIATIEIVQRERAKVKPAPKRAK